MDMAESGRLRLADVRAVFRLIGECREVGPIRTCGGATCWTACDCSPARRSRCISRFVTSAPMTNRSPSRWTAGFSTMPIVLCGHTINARTPKRDDPFHLRYFRRFTGALSYMLPRVSSRSAGMAALKGRLNEYLRACRLDDRITSSVQLPETSPAATQVSFFIGPLRMDAIHNAPNDWFTCFTRS